MLGGSTRHARRWWIVLGAGAVVAVTLAVVLWPRGDAPTAAVISAGTSNCGAGWNSPHAGEQDLTVRNTGTATTEVQLIGVPSGAIYGELEGLGAGLTRTMRVNVGGGDFAIRCGVEDTDPVTGPTVHLDGAPGPPGVLPVTDNDLAAPLKAYRSYVIDGLAKLTTDTDALRDTVHGGDLAAARTAWLAAHLDYERLGAAYGAFGDVDGAINGGPDGLADGVADAGFTGFRRLEYGLWHGQAAADLTPVADDLAGAVHGLNDTFPSAQTDPRDLGLRAHEILEDTVRDTLTGGADQGSGSELAELGANLDGTTELITVLRPLLVPRYPRLSTVDDGIARVRSLLDGDKAPAGGYLTLDALTRIQRQRLNGAVGALVENLAPVAVICEPRRIP